MNEETLSEEEKLNLEVLETWVNCWNIPGLGMEKMVDELYADNCEIYTPLQDAYFVKMGKSKKRWKRLELSLEKLYEKRQMEILWNMAKDNVVVFEARVHFFTKTGKENQQRFAAILTFENGKIIRDHTYMRDPIKIKPKSNTQ